MLLAPSFFAFRDVPALSHPFGPFLNFFGSPLAHWDALWYLQIAQDGYSPAHLPGSPGSTLPFFPLYPAAVALVSGFGGAQRVLIASYVVSLAAFLGALYVLHRLVTLELGERYARPALLLLAFFPLAFFFSAPYTESVFLLVTVSAVYAARTGHWAWAGVLAALASATRNTGVVLLVPLALIYLGEHGRHLRRDALWLALSPLGLVAFSAYLGHSYGDAFAWTHQQQAFERPSLVLPTEGIRQSAVAFWHGLTHLGNGDSRTWQHVTDFSFLLLALGALAGTLRRLPIAYGAYALIGVLIPLCDPATGQPLRGFGRYAMVLFPLFMWGALFVERRGWTDRIVPVSAGLLALFCAAFATWQPLL